MEWVVSNIYQMKDVANGDKWKYDLHVSEMIFIIKSLVTGFQHQLKSMVFII